MDVELVLHINRSRICVFYAQNGVGFKPFEYDGANEVPLYFYSEGLNFEIGLSAKSKYLNGSPDAFGDYFELIKKTESIFSYLGEQTKYKSLLVKGIERILDAFLREILLRSEKSADLKGSLKLNFVFDSDIKENEVLFVGELFRELGYTNVHLHYYDYLLLNYFDLERKIGAFDGYLLLGGNDGDLHVCLYNSLKDKSPKFNVVGKELANDPKDKIIAQMLYEDAILITGAPFSKAKGKQEVKRLLSTAKKHSKSSRNQFFVPVELSDGSSCNVKIRMNEVNDILAYQATFTKDFELVSDVEGESGLRNVDLQVIIKKSISSEIFKDKLRQHYNNVYGSEAEAAEVYGLFRSNPELIKVGDFLTTDDSVVSNPDSSKGPPTPPEAPKGPIAIPKLQEGQPDAPKEPRVPIKPPAPVSPKSSGSEKKKPLPPLPPPPVKSKGNKKPIEEKAVLKPLPMPLKTVSKPVTKSQKGKSLPPPPPPPLPPPSRKKK